MTEELPPFVVEFNDTVKAAEVFLSIARDSDLQREAVESLEQMLPKIAAEKGVCRRIDVKNVNFLLYP